MNEWTRRREREWDEHMSRMGEDEIIRLTRDKSTVRKPS